MANLMEMNLYELIGTVATASIKEIKTAYRKKALSCHPDKNPDNPKAAELFHELSKALEILTDTSAKAAYDKVLNARHQAKIRSSQLDAKRRKFQEDLEAREEAFKRSQSNTTKTDEQRLKAEIERLQKEGSRLVEEEKEAIRKQIYKQVYGKGNKETKLGDCRVKIKWKAAKDDPENGGYDQASLYRMLSKYGDVTALVISSNKKGRALVEFKEKSAAELAVQIEIGLTKNPLKLEALWANEKSSNPSAASARSGSDYESQVLQNMRRAEERRKLIEQMQAEDEKNNS